MAWRVEFHPDFAPEFAALRFRFGERSWHKRRFWVLLVHARPSHVDTLKGSRIPNLKELRFNADGGVWRVAFAFDGQRVAVLLAAGDKRGVSQGRFYQRLIYVG